MAEHFFIVGAQRSGTTYLHRVLDEHPEIEMADKGPPEPKFFVDEEQYAKGIDHYEAELFGLTPGATLNGEKSASYLESDRAADRIATHYPKARIIVILREPVARAISNYWFSVDHGLEDLPITEALRADEEARARPVDGWWYVAGQRVSASPFCYRRRGLYLGDLRRYEARFGREQMKVVLFEDTVANPDVVTDIFEFLAVDPRFRPPGLGEVVNPGRHHRDPVPAELVAELREYYEAPNRELAAAFDLDLQAWSTP
jgi:hypothetical protein